MADLQHCLFNGKILVNQTVCRCLIHAGMVFGEIREQHSVAILNESHLRPVCLIQRPKTFPLRRRELQFGIYHGLALHGHELTHQLEGLFELAGGNCCLGRYQSASEAPDDDYNQLAHN